MADYDGTGSFRELFNSHLKIIEDNSGIKGSYIAGFLGVCTLFVFIGLFDFYITNLVGIIFPIFWSLKSLQSRSKDDDDKQWLTYWIIFSLSQILDTFSNLILQIIPFYFFIKIGFLIWLFLPNFRGAEKIYHNFIKKRFKKYFDEVEKQQINTNKRKSSVNYEAEKDELSKTFVNNNTNSDKLD